MRIVALAALAVAWLCTAKTVSATGNGFAIPDTWILMPGASLAGAVRNGNTNLAYGLETSLVHRLKDPIAWAGGYADGVWEANASALRITVGPEVGYLMFGVDGGYLFEHRPGVTTHGFAIRPLLTLGIIATYCRFENRFSGANPFSVEFGALFKVPIFLSKY